MIKDFLIEYQHQEEKIQYLNDRLKEIRAGEIKSPALNRVPAGNRIQGDIIGNRIAKIAELEEQIRKARRKQKAVLTLINQLDDQRERRVLKLRYCKALSWDRLASAFGYSVRYIRTIHDRALQRLEDLAA